MRGAGANVVCQAARVPQENSIPLCSGEPTMAKKAAKKGSKKASKKSKKKSSRKK
jgi:hypothetical protein